jgi:hypothetical protein
LLESGRDGALGGAVSGIVGPLIRSVAVGVVAMELEPADFRCSTHNTDVTSQVVEQLEDDEEIIVFGRLGGRSGTEAFEVVVWCPGPGGSESGHKLACRGTRTR